MAESKLYILLVEDDANLGLLLGEYLRARGFDCDWKTNGKEGMDAFRQRNYDFLILDVMMPQKDGFSLAADVRASDPDIPILFLTAKSMKEDTLRGFQVGADDYMTKPFNMDELVARIQAIVRRTGKTEVKEGPEFQMGKYLFNSDRMTLTGPEGEQKLTRRENELLFMLVTSKGTLDKSYALKVIWGDDSYFNGRSMDVYLSRLRKYFKSDDRIEIINVHGKGYKLTITS
jgi:DNA-binding response OmpR family regulator